MTDTIYAVPTVAMGDGAGFELLLRGSGGDQQKFNVRLTEIPELIASLAAVAWASQATNRPAAGAQLPAVTTFPVQRSEVGRMENSTDPVVVVELFGGVKLGLHFTAQNGADIARKITAGAAASAAR